LIDLKEDIGSAQKHDGGENLETSYIGVSPSKPNDEIKFTQKLALSQPIDKEI
jgi:hypothetical protein